jgi:hypothetical protein
VRACWTNENGTKHYVDILFRLVARESATELVPLTAHVEHLLEYVRRALGVLDSPLCQAFHWLSRLLQIGIDSGVAVGCVGFADVPYSIRDTIGVNGFTSMEELLLSLSFAHSSARITGGCGWTTPSCLMIPTLKAGGEGKGVLSPVHGRGTRLGCRKNGLSPTTSDMNMSISRSDTPIGPQVVKMVNSAEFPLCSIPKLGR